jgi:hypothetical protein
LGERDVDLCLLVDLLKVPAGSRTCLPKIHTPVTRWEESMSSECLSTLPTSPSAASTLYPIRSVPAV